MILTKDDFASYFSEFWITNEMFNIKMIPMMVFYEADDNFWNCAISTSNLPVSSLASRPQKLIT
jgi:hypothetical protein